MRALRVTRRWPALDRRVVEDPSEEMTLELRPTGLEGAGYPGIQGYTSAWMFSIWLSRSRVIMGVNPITFAIFFWLIIHHKFLPHSGKWIIQGCDSLVITLGCVCHTQVISKDLSNLTGSSHAPFLFLDNLCLSQGLCIWSRAWYSQVKEDSSILKLVAQPPSPKTSPQNVLTK